LVSLSPCKRTENSRNQHWWNKDDIHNDTFKLLEMYFRAHEWWQILIKGKISQLTILVFNKIADMFTYLIQFLELIMQLSKLSKSLTALKFKKRVSRICIFVQ